MNQDNIIEMAREACLICESRPVTAWIESTDLTPYLTRFAALVAAHWQKIHQQEMSMMSELCADRILEEREACAKVCEELKNYYGVGTDMELCAAAIRARGEK